MAKVNKDRTHTFKVDYQSDVDNMHYLGTFQCKKLSIRDIATLGVRSAQLNGGMHYDAANPGMGIDEDTAEFNNVIAHLEVSLMTWPEWWDLNNISDSKLVTLVYTEVLKFEDSFHGHGRTVREEQADSSGAVQDADGTGKSPTVVDQEVQSALEP